MITGEGMTSTNIIYMTNDEYYNSTAVFDHDEIIVIVANDPPNLRQLRDEIERIKFNMDDIYPMEHEYYFPEDIPKKINFKSIQKLHPVFNRKIINSMSGFRGRSLRRKQSSIYK